MQNRFLVPWIMRIFSFSASNLQVPPSKTILDLLMKLPSRVVIEKVQPSVDDGKFPAKRVQGDEVLISCVAMCDGHDHLSCLLHYRSGKSGKWQTTAMEFWENDIWRATIPVDDLGYYIFKIEAWIDRFKTWSYGFKRKLSALREAKNGDTATLAVDLMVGAIYLEQYLAATKKLPKKDQAMLRSWTERLRSSAETKSFGEVANYLSAFEAEVNLVLLTYPDKYHLTKTEKEYFLWVDPPLANFSAWYEFFPRSLSPTGKHATLHEAEGMLGYVSTMGFDIVYLPPIHPIGTTCRKGKNNSLHAGPDDVGSPWAIGGRAGGHMAIHPELGTLKDFRHFIDRAETLGLKVAMDIAYQCSPDHPYVKEHPEWFLKRPDGSVQYAENPPKKYQDIYPFYFDGPEYREMWQELKNIVLYWIEHGIRIFRVDNPHTKPFSFWQWMIAEVKKIHPDIIFLSEAFTRPHVRYYLAKIGFTQGYTYFTWRDTKQELVEYLTHLTQTEVKEYFRPNFWPNTPDILARTLRNAPLAEFRLRFVLAATLCSNYGIYGPAFELGENEPASDTNEEYLNSEKYELKHWQLESAESLRPLIARINRIRKEHPVFRNTNNIRFHQIDNDQLICYSKATADLSNRVLIVVNLDAKHKQSGWTSLDLASLGLNDETPYQVRDLLSEEAYTWVGGRNFVILDPTQLAAHIFVIGTSHKPHQATKGTTHDQHGD
jgi:starch synthase (maltosyl-transferring)